MKKTDFLIEPLHFCSSQKRLWWDVRDQNLNKSGIWKAKDSRVCFQTGISWQQITDAFPTPRSVAILLEYTRSFLIDTRNTTHFQSPIAISAEEETYASVHLYL